MTVADNMGFSLKLKRADKAIISERVGRAADILGLNPYLERYPRQLSGGQRQRVAMVRAIVRDPKVFLFDEPLSNPDAKLRVQMRTAIKIGRAPCRERVCQMVSISVVAVKLTKNQTSYLMQTTQPT